MATTSIASEVGLRRLVLSEQDQFTCVQDFLDFPAVYALLCSSLQTVRPLQDVSLYESSARRRSMIQQIPPYIAFRWRTPGEIEAIEQQLLGRSATAGKASQIPSVPPRILEEAATVEIVLPETEEEVPATASLEEERRSGTLRSRTSALRAMEQAKLTFFFVKGLRAYEAKRMEESELCLEAALALAPEDDILLARLADTRYAQYQAVNMRSAEGDAEKLKMRSLELYRKAVRANPSSSYGFNGLSLFQDSAAEKRKYLLRAVALDDENSYALVNLAMCLEDEVRLSARAAGQQLSLYRRALAINPNLFYARPAIAQLHLQLHQYGQALDMLAEHLRRRPEDESARQLHSALDQLLRERAAETQDA